MERKLLEKLIRNLGYPYSSLIDNEILSCSAEIRKVPDSNFVEIEIVPGLDILCSGQLQVFDAIYINLDETSDRAFNFRKELPGSLSLVHNREDVRAAMGTPLPQASEIELLGTNLHGNDTYQLNVKFHPEAMLDFQYDCNEKIIAISISRMDSEF